MQSTQMPKTLKETDPHDIFAIEQVLAAHANRAPPLVHDPAAQPAAPQAPAVPEISVGAPSSQVDATYHASAASELKDVRPGDLKTLGDASTATWTKGVLMAALGLGGAIAAAAWQHYGDQAKAMAIGWAPPSVIAAIAPSEKPAAEQESVPVIQAAAADQAAAQSAPAAPAETATPAAQAAATAPVASAPSTERAQLQSDLVAMTQQVEELKASIAQLKASQAQLIRDAAKASEAKASEAKPVEQNLRPKITAAAAPPPPRPAVAPVRKPKPAYPPAQAAYVPPPPPAVAPPPPAPPPQAVADDGQPVVRPPMPLR